MKTFKIISKTGKEVKVTYENLNESNFEKVFTSQVYSTGQLIETYKVGNSYYDKYYPTWLESGRIVQNFNF